MRITRNEDKSSPAVVFVKWNIIQLFICFTLSVTTVKKRTFYRSMASLDAFNYSFGGLASLQETQYLPITRGCNAVLLVNG